MMGYQAEQKYDAIFSCLDPIHERDERTDGHWPTAWYHAYA